MSDKPREMFLNACSYSKAAGVLNELALGKESGLHSRDLALPSAVNAALALELLFKTLYFLERGTDFKVNGRHSHDFHALYCQLEARRRDTMEAFFAERIRARSMSDVEDMERVSGIPVPRDLVGNLKSWKDVFTKCRYAHELPGKNLTMWFFRELEDSVADPILRLKPELEPFYRAR